MNGSGATSKTYGWQVHVDGPISGQEGAAVAPQTACVVGPAGIHGLISE